MRRRALYKVNKEDQFIFTIDTVPSTTPSITKTFNVTGSGGSQSGKIQSTKNGSFQTWSFIYP